jgi:nickel transport protein
MRSERKVCRRKTTRFAGILAAAALAGLALLAPAARAHRVNIFAWVEGDTIHVECKYPDGRRVHAGVIRVLEAGGAELLNGKTDDKGEFAFKIPKAADLNIVLEAGMGHRAEWPMAKEELSSGGQEPPPPPVKPEPAGMPAAGAAPQPPPDSQEIERALERALDKKLAPVLKMVVESRDPGPRLTDVLGGIGYIIGLVGLAAFFKSRKAEKTKD